MSEYETKLSLDNSTEHLKTVLDNIRVANKDLTDIKKVIESKQIENNTLISLGENIELNNKSNIKRGIYLEQYCILTDKKVNLLLKQEIEVDKRVSQANEKLNRINKDFSISLSNYLKTVDAQNIVLINLQYKLESTQSQIKNNEETIKEQSSIKTKQENEIIGLNNQIEEAQKDLAKFIIKSNLTQEAINNLIQDEKDKIKNPLELVKREQDKLSKLKTDIDTIRRRLTEQFKRQNPRSILPIELQDK